MPRHHPTLCEYCGTPVSNELPRANGASRRSVVCTSCHPLEQPIFTTRRGDGVNSFHEILIRQNHAEPRRKLIETTSLHFIIFFDERNEITGFELSDRDDRHLLTWGVGRPASYFGVKNIGTGYANRDEIVINGEFPQDEVLREFKACSLNLTEHTRRILEEGMRSYCKPDLRP